MLTTRKTLGTRTVLILAAIAMATLAFTVPSAHAALITVSPTPPAVDDADIAMLNETGSDYDWGSSVVWPDRPWRGQTFTTGNAPSYVLDRITVQSSGTSATLPHITDYTLRIGEVSGTSFTEIASETATFSGNFNQDDFVTYVLSPIVLSPLSVYGFDLDLTGSNRGWRTSAWMLNRNDPTEYGDGSAYNSTGSSIGLLSQDRIFHLNMEAIPEPATLSLLGLGGLALLRRRRRRA